MEYAEVFAGEMAKIERRFLARRLGQLVERSPGGGQKLTMICFCREPSRDSHQALRRVLSERQPILDHLQEGTVRPARLRFSAILARRRGCPTTILAKGFGSRRGSPASAARTVPQLGGLFRQLLARMASTSGPRGSLAGGGLLASRRERKRL